MKFFYINNDRCTDCGMCIGGCPTRALYDSDGGKEINYDNCITCGACYRECQAGAITVEKLEKITRQMKSLDDHRRRIESLESDNARLMHRVNALVDGLRGLISRMPVAAFAADREGRIVSYNKMFAETLPLDRREMQKAGIALRTDVLSEVLPADIKKLYGRAMSAAEGVYGEPVSWEGRNYMAYVCSMADSGLVVAMFMNLNEGVVLRSEIAELLKKTIDRKMEMVQNIGFLLGEEVSTVVENLNTVIDMVEGNRPEEEQRR